MATTKFIRLDMIEGPEFDARLAVDEEAMIELTESVREHGVLLPLIVRKTDAGYTIVAGNRRYQAARRAGLAAVPCDVRKLSDPEADAIRIHENTKRLDLSHIDQAQTFEHLREAYDMTEDQIARVIGKSKPYVSQHLTLLHSDPVLVQAVREGRLNFSVARELMQIDDPDERTRFMGYAENGGASTEIVHEWVRTWKKDAAELPATKEEAAAVHVPLVSHEPMYPCAGCEQPTSVAKLRLVRYCPDCFLILMAALAEQRRAQAHQDDSEPRSPQG